MIKKTITLTIFIMIIPIFIMIIPIIIILMLIILITLIQNNQNKLMLKKEIKNRMLMIINGKVSMFLVDLKVINHKA